MISETDKERNPLSPCKLLPLYLKIINQELFISFY